MSKLSKRYQARLAEYKKLAKKADAQMRTLERYIKLAKRDVYETKTVTKKVKVGEKINPETGRKKNIVKKVKTKVKVLTDKYKKYAVLEEYAYGTAQQDIKRLYGGGSTFDRVPKKKGKYISIDELNARIEAMEKFLSKPSAYLKKSKTHSSYPDALKRSAKAFSAALSDRVGHDINLSPDDIKQLLEDAEEQGLTEDYGKYEVLEVLYEIQNNDDLMDAINKIKDQDIADPDEEATVIRDKAEELGIPADKSQIISTMMSSQNIDFSKFRTIL